MPKFDWTSEGKVGATWNAHRLVLRASQRDEKEGEKGVNSLQVRLMDRLYEDFHSKSRDMSDNEYLAGVAKEFSLFESEEAAKKCWNRTTSSTS